MFKSALAIMEGTKAAFSAIKANAMRSALTCLGIIIGVAAVVTVVAVMQGFTKQINDQFVTSSGLGKVFTVQFNNAFPVSMGEISLSSDAYDTFTEFTINFAYETYDFVDNSLSIFS